MYSNSTTQERCNRLPQIQMHSYNQHYKTFIYRTLKYYIQTNLNSTILHHLYIQIYIYLNIINIQHHHMIIRVIFQRIKHLKRHT